MAVVSTSSTDLRTLLVANRGEIALRVFRTCERHGIRTVAVYTDADAGAPHVRDGRSSPCPVGRRTSTSSAVVAAAGRSAPTPSTPATASCPRTPRSPRRRAAPASRWVGPPADVIERMGRKDAAREIAVAAGVPVVPVATEVGRAAAATATRPPTHRLPGAGQGRRRRRRQGHADRAPAADLDDAIAAAEREAARAFGDDTLLLEKYVERGRHIEVQVLGDTHGNVIHL